MSRRQNKLLRPSHHPEVADILCQAMTRSKWLPRSKESGTHSRPGMKS